MKDCFRLEGVVLLGLQLVNSGSIWVSNCKREYEGGLRFVFIDVLGAVGLVGRGWLRSPF